jgi:hypothetical protein
MLRSVNVLYDYVLDATDGQIGRCRDFLFDDKFWTIRYMEAETSKWMPGRRVLISPISLGKPDWQTRLFQVQLTKNQIKEAPGIDLNAPVSRQHEILWAKHYGWSYYWMGHGIWGADDNIKPPGKPDEMRIDAEEDRDSGDSNLRSTSEVTGYHIQAKDDKIGHVEDFIVDDELWTLRYLIIDTRNWLPGGRKVLVSPGWVDHISWADRIVGINLSVKAIENGPEYDPARPVNREYEERLYDFYGRPYYWK